MRVLSQLTHETHAVLAHSSEHLTSSHVLEGEGDAHGYLLEFGPDGFVGRHRASCGQVFVVLSGEGWVAGADGARVRVEAGDVISFERGEMHEKGSASGMRALMVQVRNLGNPESRVGRP